MDKPTASQIIDTLGGTAAVAKLCQVKAPSVSDWRKHGIPAARRQFLQLLRPDAFSGSGITKRELINRLALGSDTGLAVLLQLPREVVEGWSDETAVPDSLRLRALLSESVVPLADVAPADPEADRIVPVETA